MDSPMTTKKVLVPFYQEFSTIKCLHCDHSFILLSVIEREEDFQEEYDFMKQGMAKHCPYCGVAMAKDGSP